MGESPNGAVVNEARWQQWIRLVRHHPGMTAILGALVFLVGAILYWAPLITFSDASSSISFSVSQYSGMCSSSLGQFAQGLDTQISGGCAGAGFGAALAVIFMVVGGLGALAGAAIYSARPAARPTDPGPFLTSEPASQQTVDSNISTLQSGSARDSAPHQDFGVPTTSAER